MSATNTTPTTTSRKDYGWYKGRRAFTLTQKVNLTHGSSFAALTATLPPRCAVLWSSLIVSGAAAVTGNDATNTANALALVMHVTSGASVLTQPHTATVSNPTGTATNGSIMLQLATDTSTSTPVRGPSFFQTTKPSVNTSTVDALLVVQPAYTNSNRLYASGTSGFVFGTSTAANTSYTGQALVSLYCEEYDDQPGY